MDATTAYELLADVYDRWLTGDEAAGPCLGFYREALRGNPVDVLELGCGTGRIAAALAEDGHRVVGLDGSSAMLRRAQAAVEDKAVGLAGSINLVAGTFDDLPFDSGSFDVVLMPMRTVGHLLETSEQERCFREAARVLRPRGRFLLDHYQFDPSWAKAHDGVPRLMYAGVGVGDDESRALTIWDRYVYDIPASRLHCTVRIWTTGFEAGDETASDVEFDFRWFAAEDLVALGRAAGLQLESCWGSFEREPHDEHSDHIVLVLRKPGG